MQSKEQLSQAIQKAQKQEKISRRVFLGAAGVATGDGLAVMGHFHKSEIGIFAAAATIFCISDVIATRARNTITTLTKEFYEFDNTHHSAIEAEYKIKE